MTRPRLRSVVAAAVAAAVAVVAALLLGAYDLVDLGTRHGAPSAAPVRPPPSVPITSPTVSPAPSDAHADGPPDGSASPADVLRAWDRRRAAAYAEGDAAGLRVLYPPGSTAAKADLRLLRGYLRRGLRVTGMRMQLLDVTVLDRSPDRLRLRVTDRLVGAVARGDDGARVLPRDRASTRMLTMRHTDDGSWQVRSVRPVKQRSARR